MPTGLGNPLGNPLARPRAVASAVASTCTQEVQKDGWLLVNDRDNRLIFKRRSSVGISTANDVVISLSGYGGSRYNVEMSSSNSGPWAAVSMGPSPYLLLYKYNDSTYTFDAMSAPTVPSAGNVAISRDAKYLAWGITTTVNNCVKIYERSGNTFTFKSEHVATNQVYNGHKIMSFSPDGTKLIVPLVNAPYLTIIELVGNSFSEAVPTLNPPLSTAPYGLSMSPDNTRLALTDNNASPYIGFYKLTNGVWEKQSNPATIPTASVYKCDFSMNGKYVLCSGNSVGVMLYKLSGDVFVYDTTVSFSGNTLPGAWWSGVSNGNDSDGFFIFGQAAGSSAQPVIYNSPSQYVVLPVPAWSPQAPTSYIDFACISR